VDYPKRFQLKNDNLEIWKDLTQSIVMQSFGNWKKLKKQEAYDPLAVKSLKSRYVALPLVSKLTG
jgi:hypothetical protein